MTHSFFLFWVLLFLHRQICIINTSRTDAINEFVVISKWQCLLFLDNQLVVLYSGKYSNLSNCILKSCSSEYLGLNPSHYFIQSKLYLCKQGEGNSRGRWVPAAIQKYTTAVPRAASLKQSNMGKYLQIFSDFCCLCSSFGSWKELVSCSLREVKDNVPPKIVNISNIYRIKGVALNHTPRVSRRSDCLGKSWPVCGPLGKEMLLTGPGHKTKCWLLCRSSQNPTSGVF